MYTQKVLVVSPNDQSRESLADALRAGGFGVFEATTGMDALERASLDLPGLVFIDLALDENIDGWTTVKFLGDSPRTEGIPIVVVTDGRLEGDVRRAALMGCKGLVERGDPSETVAAARSILGEPQVRVRPETPAGVLRRRYRLRPVSAA